MTIGDVKIIGLTKTVCEGFQRKVLIKVENQYVNGGGAGCFLCAVPVK